MTTMRDSYIDMASDLQKSIPLDVSLLIYLKYLDLVNWKKEISVVRIGKLAQLLPHVITEQEVTAAAGCTSPRKFVKAKRWKV